MRKIAVTYAAVVDTTVFEPLLDRANSSRNVYADRGSAHGERELSFSHDSEASGSSYVGNPIEQTSARMDTE